MAKMNCDSVRDNDSCVVYWMKCAGLYGSEYVHCGTCSKQPFRSLEQCR